MDETFIKRVSYTYRENMGSFIVGKSPIDQHALSLGILIARDQFMKHNIDDFNHTNSLEIWEYVVSIVQNGLRDFYLSNNSHIFGINAMANMICSAYIQNRVYHKKRQLSDIRDIREYLPRVNELIDDIRAEIIQDDIDKEVQKKQETKIVELAIEKIDKRIQIVEKENAEINTSRPQNVNVTSRDIKFLSPSPSTIVSDIGRFSPTSVGGTIIDHIDHTDHTDQIEQIDRLQVEKNEIKEMDIKTFFMNNYELWKFMIKKRVIKANFQIIKKFKLTSKFLDFASITDILEMESLGLVEIGDYDQLMNTTSTSSDSELLLNESMAAVDF